MVSRSYFCCESTHTPLCRVACASQLTPPNVGEVRKALARGVAVLGELARPAEHSVDADEKPVPCTATLP